MDARINDLISIENKLVVACNAMRCVRFITLGKETIMLASRDSERKVTA